jgi:YidC/Oxa1 family membrane protein insertase
LIPFPTKSMEKSYLIFGIAALGLAAALQFREAGRFEEMRRMRQESVVAAVVPHQPTPIVLQKSVDAIDAPAGERFFLENDAMSVKILANGGGIESIALKKYPAALHGDGPWQFHPSGQPALSLALLPAGGERMPLLDVPFAPIAARADSITLQGTLADGTTVTREYRMGSKGEPYQIRHLLRIVPSTAAGRAMAIAVSLGSLTPGAGDPSLLQFVSYDGKKAKFTSPRAFGASGGFFGIGRRGERTRIEETRPTAWAALKNQFFTAILTPDVAALGATTFSAAGIGGAIGGSVELPMAMAGHETVLAMDYYVGPKEYARLERMGQNQDLVMQFGWFGFIGKILLLMMMGIHHIVPNWGWTILLLTLIVRLLLWPLTGAQVRSSRALARLQGPIREIQARHKNHPKKVQEETLRLFREAGVNPAAGCLPILIQIPIFFGLYAMLRSASELRFASFFWIADLSAADTVGHIGQFSINPLPLLMAATTFLQMHLSPTPSSSPGQRLLFQAMPFIFLCFAYNLPSGLVLYWTVQNCCSIVQQRIIQRRLARQEKEIKPQREGKKKKSRTATRH